MNDEEVDRIKGMLLIIVIIIGFKEMR